MWLILQGLIIFAVVASNIHWRWTPNTYLASAMGIGAAWCVTKLITVLIDWRRAVRRQPHTLVTVSVQHLFEPLRDCHTQSAAIADGAPAVCHHAQTTNWANRSRHCPTRSPYTAGACRSCKYNFGYQDPRHTTVPLGSLHPRHFQFQKRRPSACRS
jgi:hypothetical protein